MTGDFENRVEIGRAAIKMHRDDGAGFFRDRRSDQTRIDGVGFWININQNRTRTCQLDGPHGRDGSMCRGNDLIAVRDVARQQGKKQGIGARGDSQPVGGTAEGGKFPFEGDHLLAQDKISPGKDA